jgi:lipid-A-disaccharide synthase
MVCSGTATLESAYFGLPMVILYKVAWPTWIIAKRLVKLPHIGMPNVIAGHEIAREFLQSNARPYAIAEELNRLLKDPAARCKQQSEFKSVIASLGLPGAGARAAEAVARTLAL